MDYKHKDALDRARNLHKDAIDMGAKDVIKICEIIFPELTESDDERIRKELLEHCKNQAKPYIKTGNKCPQIQSWIDWLEKQGEQKVSEYDIVKTIKERIIEHFENHLIIDKCFSIGGLKDDILKIINRVEFEKQDEQKSVDEIKPKFKVGDWIVQENVGVFQIVEVCKSWYELIDIEGFQYSISFVREYMCHLWTIKDAKEGDVLTNGKIIVIFKHFEEPSYRQHIVAYIGLDIGGDIQITDDTWRLGIDKAKPATKEQRDLLFQKMEEAGYKWDSEKKELRKIENPAWSEEDENTWKELIEEVKDQLDSVPAPDCRDKEDEKVLKQLTRWLVWIKSIKQRLGE